MDRYIVFVKQKNKIKKKQTSKNEDNENVTNVIKLKDAHVFIGFTVYAQLVYILAT